MDDRGRPNEQWWAEHGGDWYQECQHRRATIPYYMIQEVFLSGYFSLAAPCRALEFGCGFGRQLSYLRRIPGLDLYGCDQSPTMLAQAEKLIERPWLDERVRLVPPAGRLPYEDKSFDIVYSVSVLIHVRPEDVLAVIRELVRVARWHVLHIENPPTAQTVMTCPEHDGCWAHPLEALYAQLGLRLDALPSHGANQSGYRVMLDERRAAPDLTALAGRLSEAETRLDTARQGLEWRATQAEKALAEERAQDGQRQAKAAESEAALRRELEVRQATIVASSARIEQAEAAVAALTGKIEQAEAAAAKLRQELDESHAELTRQRDRNVEAEAQIARTEEAGAKLLKELNEGRAELTRRRERNAATEGNLRKAQETISKLRQEMEKEAAESTELRAQVQAGTTALRIAQESVAALQERVRWLEANMARIEGSLTWRFMRLCHGSGLLSAPYALIKGGRRLLGGKSASPPPPAPTPAQGVNDRPAPTVAEPRAQPAATEFQVPFPVTSQAFADMLKIRPVSFNRVYGAPALMSPQERVLLYGLTFALAPRRYLEIGTCRGGSAVVVSAAMDDLNKGQAFGVDPEPAVTPETLAAIGHRFTLVTGASPHAVNRAVELAGGEFDLVLVDGDHSYEATLADLQGVLPAATPDAVILIHDAYNALVGRAIEDFLAMQDGEMVDGGILATTRNPVEENGRMQDWGGLRMLRRCARPVKHASIHA